MSFNNDYINVKALSYKNRKICSAVPPRFISNKFIVNEDFDYYVGALNSDLKITVPKGFVFDGASVPFPFSSIVPKSHPIYMKAACLHDFIYATPDIPINRLGADYIFYESMVVMGTPKFWAKAMYYAVRFGGSYWWYRRRGGYKLFGFIPVIKAMKEKDVQSSK